MKSRGVKFIIGTRDESDCCRCLQGMHFESKAQSKKSYSSHTLSKHSNRVRFSAVLVTAVETRPRTRTEEKPTLYWTAKEIASLRLRQSIEDLSNGPGKGYVKRKHCIQGEGGDHDDLLRSLDTTAKLRTTSQCAANVSRKHPEYFGYEKSFSQNALVCLDEENGPHLLDCEWL